MTTHWCHQLPEGRCRSVNKNLPKFLANHSTKIHVLSFYDCFNKKTTSMRFSAEKSTQRCVWRQHDTDCSHFPRVVHQVSDQKIHTNSSNKLLWLPAWLTDFINSWQWGYRQGCKRNKHWLQRGVAAIYHLQIFSNASNFQLPYVGSKLNLKRELRGDTH
jgi:hypothetical protein